MRNTNLALIEAAADAALEDQRANPVLPASVLAGAGQARLTVIAGFDVVDEEAHKEALKQGRIERHKKIKKFGEDRDALARKLEEAGVAAQAIIPKTAWETICTRTGLFRLSPNKDGKINVSVKILDELRNKAANDAFGAELVVIALMAISGAIFGFVNSSPGPLQFAGSFLGLIVFGLPSMFLCMFLDGIVRSVTTRAYIASFCKKPHAELLSVFFPGGVSPRNTDSVATLILPTPPADVAQILKRAQRLDLKVAAVPDAISFAETPKQLLYQELGRREEIERQNALSDPIIYLEHGSAVAIIAQFGDFVIEQDVVNEVVNSEYLV